MSCARFTPPRTRLAIPAVLTLVLAFACAGLAQISCPHFTSIGQSATDLAGSSGLCCGYSNYKVGFWANYSDGSQQQATITAASSTNPSVASGSGRIGLSITGTGAATVTFTVTYPIYTAYYGPPCRIGANGQEICTWSCRTESQGAAYPQISASGNYFDPAAALVLFRSPANDPSWPIGAYESQFGTPGLALLNTGSGTRTDYPLQWTSEDNGMTVFTGNGMNESVTVDNPGADEGGWWPTPGPDGHLIVDDTAHRYYWDFYQLVTPPGNPSAPSFGPSGEVVAKDLTGTGNYGGNDVSGYENASGNGAPGRGGTTASYITGFAGDILPGELDCATCIGHALAVVVPEQMDSCNGYSTKQGCGAGVLFENPLNGRAAEQCNEGAATGGDATPGNYAGNGSAGSGGNPIELFCEGAKIFLPAGFTLHAVAPDTSVPVAAQAIANALIQFGGIIEDQGGGTLRFYTAGYFDTDSNPTYPQNMDYEGISSSGLAAYMAQIGAGLRIAYTCASGCTTAP